MTNLKKNNRSHLKDAYNDEANNYPNTDRKHWLCKDFWEGVGLRRHSITNISAGKRDTLVRVYTKRDLLQMLQIMKYE